jgi:ketosteroid isomerase-like protein
MSPVERVSQTDVPAPRCCCELFRLSYRYAVRSRAGTRKRPVRPGLTVERRAAQELLDRLHRAQNEYYAGGDSRGLSDLLAADVRWSVPGDDALAGVYIGVDHVLDYMQRRRRLAAYTLRLVRRDVLVGRGQRIGALTDGVVLRSGRVHTWGTVVPGRRRAYSPLLATPPGRRRCRRDLVLTWPPISASYRAELGWCGHQVEIGDPVTLQVERQCRHPSPRTPRTAS